MRAVAVLGSTTSATVCNSRKTGNIVLMAAGGNGTRGVAMGISTGINVDGLKEKGVRVVSKTRLCSCCGSFSGRRTVAFSHCGSGLQGCGFS